MLVRGDPGSGKSILLQALALVAAGHAPTLAEAHPDLFGAVADRFPVLLALADYAATLDPRTTPLLRDHLRATAEAVYPGGATTLDAHLNAGNALILLDGLDEIPDAKLRTRVVRAVEVLLAGLPPNNRCAISTRPQGGFPITRTTARHLAPLDNSQISQLLINLLRAHTARTGTSPDLRAEVNALVERLGPASIDDLAHNPLLITIIAACNLAGVALPHDRVVLYHRILRTLIQTWENARSLAHNDRKIPESNLWRVWGDVALSAQLQHGSSSRSRDAWQNDLRTALRHRHPGANNDALADEYLDLATRHTGLLARRASGEFAFWHSTFGEYLAGYAVAHDRQHLKKLRDDPRTVEVVAFALGYIARILGEPNRAEALLRSLTDDNLRPCEPLHAPALRYACACLSRTQLTDSTLWDDLLVRLIDRFCLLPYSPNLAALAEFLDAFPERRLGPAASQALLDRAIHPTLSTRTLELLARDFTNARVLARCEIAITDSPHADLAFPAALALLRAGRVRPDVCAAIVKRDLFDIQDRDIPFSPTRFGRDVRSHLDARARDSLVAQLETPETAVPAALILALVEPESSKLSAPLEHTLSPPDPDPDVLSIGDHRSPSPAGLSAALGWLALHDRALAARILRAALAETHDHNPETYPWPVLKGLFPHSKTRDYLLVVLADALLSAPTAEPSDLWSRASRLCSLAGEAFHAALEVLIAERLGESYDPARLAYRLVLLHDSDHFSRPLHANPVLIDTCLADPRPWLRAQVLERLAPQRILHPPVLSAAALDAAIANLGAEDDPDHMRWPEEPHRFGNRTRILPALVRTKALDLLRSASAGGLSTSIVVALERALDATSTTVRGWAAVLLAQGNSDHAGLRSHLEAAVTTPSIDLAAAAAEGLVGDPLPPTGDLRARCHEALWLAHIHKFPQPRTPFAITVPPGDATIARILDRNDINEYQDLAWLFTNPHTVEFVCCRILAPARDHEPVPRFVLLAVKQDPAITDKLCEIIDATPPDQAVDLAWLLRLRIHRASDEESIDPRVRLAYNHCLDALDPAKLAVPIEQLVWFNVGGTRLRAAIRRCLRNADLATRQRVLDACIRHAGQALPKPVDPSALRKAITDVRGLTPDEVLAALAACAGSDDSHDRLDAGIFLLALGAPSEAVHAALDPLAATHGERHSDPSRCEWVLPEPIFRSLHHISQLRRDQLAATLLQHLDGTPLPPHLYDEARATLRDPAPQNSFDSTSTWALGVLLRTGGPTAVEAVADLEAALISIPKDRLNRDTASHNLKAVTLEALFANADHPAVADLCICLALDRPRQIHFQLDWELIPRALSKCSDSDALVAALRDRLTDPDHGLVAARILTTAGHADDELLDHVLDHLLTAPAHERSRDDAALRLAVWPRLRTRWQAGALSPDQLARALALAAHDEFPAADLPVLIEPLLDAPRWRVRCPAVGVCYTRTLPVDPARLLAALRACVADAPYLDRGLVDAIKKNLDAVLPDLLHRRKTTPDDEWQYHPLENLPVLRPFQLSRLWHRFDTAPDREVHHLIDRLRALGADEAKLRARLLTRLFNGEHHLSLLLRDPDSEWKYRGSPWLDPREQTEPIRCGLLLAAHADWLDSPASERLAAALDSTPTALETLITDLTARPFDPDLLASAQTLAEHCPDDSFLVHLARAWWFGRLPHEAIVTCGSLPSEALRITQPRQHAIVQFLAESFSDSELRRLVRYYYPEIATRLPSTPAPIVDVADAWVRLLDERGRLDNAFFDLLRTERPRLIKTIDNLEHQAVDP